LAAFSLTRAPFKAESEDENISNFGRDLDGLRIFIAVAATIRTPDGPYPNAS
jgi:hypothetical protein